MIWKFVSYLLKFIDPEKAHTLSIFFIRIGFYPKLKIPRIDTRIEDLLFKNPIGLAAGFDK